MFNVRKFLWGVHCSIFKSITKNVCKVFNYLTCCNDEQFNERELLKGLYISGQIDEAKYIESCEKCLEGNFDYEELQISNESLGKIIGG